MFPEEISEKLKDKLGGWLSGGAEIDNFTIEDWKELSTFRDSETSVLAINLYRAIKSGEELQKNLFVSFEHSSWTYSLDMARNFKIEDLPIIRAIIPINYIFLDTTFFPKEFLEIELGGFWEEEVIVNPITMEYEIIE